MVDEHGSGPGGETTEGKGAVPLVNQPVLLPRIPGSRYEGLPVHQTLTPPSSMGGAPTTAVRNSTIAGCPGDGPDTMVVTPKLLMSARAIARTAGVIATGRPTSSWSSVDSRNDGCGPRYGPGVNASPSGIRNL